MRIFNIHFIVTIILGYIKHCQKVITISNFGKKNTILYFIKIVNDTILELRKNKFQKCIIDIIKNIAEKIQLSIIYNILRFSSYRFVLFAVRICILFTPLIHTLACNF